MFSLIKAEFIKIIKKKSFLIVTLIFILYCLLTNVIYQNSDILNEYEEDITYLEDENKSLDLSLKKDLETYVANLEKIEVEKYKDEYDSNVQKYLIERYLAPKISLYLNYKYISLEDAKLEKIDEEIKDIEEKIRKENWEYFTKLNIANYKEALKDDLDTSTKERYNTLLKMEEYRLNEGIAYDKDNYLHNALNEIAIDIAEYYNLKYASSLTKEEKTRFDYITKEMQINKYIIEHKVDINNDQSLRAVLKNFSQEFDLFILIYIIMISGSIVSEEFNKGTIKSLLTRPYKRSTILTSKLITVLLFIPIVMVMMCSIEIIMGGMIFGFSSLNVPVVLYSHGIIKTWNIFRYLVLTLLCNIPLYLILGVIAFMISTIMASTSAAITIAFLIYLIGNVIANLALVYKFKIFNYLVFLHWDFNYLVNLEANPYNFSATTSLIVVGVYLIVMLCITYIYFDKKDVKNI